MKHWKIMNWNKGSLFSLLYILLFTTSCTSEFDQWVREEMRSGELYNNLIFGMEIGQDKQFFFERCAELNKQKLITQGKGRYAQYIMQPKDTLRVADRIEMQFYGIFKKEKISGMNMKFSYVGWAPWNEIYQPEVLIENLKDTLINWFPGNNFRKLDVEVSDTPAYVKVDGNRLIRMFIINEFQVAVRIEDLKLR